MCICSREEFGKTPVWGSSPSYSDFVGQGKFKTSEILTSTPKCIFSKKLSITFGAVNFKFLKGNNYLFTSGPTKKI
jgi:hypothetical protein